MNKKIFILISIGVFLAVIPVTLFLVQREQKTRSRASAASALYFTPTPATISAVIPTSTPTPTATPAPIPGDTYLALTVYEHGIGNSGDKQYAGYTSSNKNPTRKTVTTYVKLFKANGDSVWQGTSPLAYSTAGGNFQGTVAVPNTIASGEYTLKIRTPYHLKGIIHNLNIAAGKTNTIPGVALITGDANNNNALNISDYSLLLDCYNDLAPAKACDDSKKIATDFNDDGFVNQDDYNLLLKEFSVLSGDN